MKRDHEKRVQVGRVAMRHEGNNVNVYYAKNDTMEDAVLLLSAPVGIAGMPGVRDMMLDIGRRVVRELVKEVHGKDVTTWGGPEPAPEHERSGHA